MSEHLHGVDCVPSQCRGPLAPPTDKSTGPPDGQPCPIHGQPPVLVYPCCVGAKGGKATSEAKRASARANVARARIARLQRRPTRP